MKKYIYIPLIAIAAGFAFVGCKKSKLLSSPDTVLSIDQDTILFDTIFTTIGSTTQIFKVHNRNNGKIIISNVSLGGGTSSPFRINVDGSAGVSFDQIEIEANDSIFLFAEVTIDPNNATNPLVVEDSILFMTNGVQQKIILNAWGQDAYFHVKEIITGDETWPTDKPHVIYDYCIVDSSHTLTIPSGTMVHGHNDAVLFVYKSHLEVNGTASDPVTFKQDRLEQFILEDPDSVAGQWGGIVFREALESHINGANISNAVIGVRVDSFQVGNKVNLDQVRIDNSLYAGVYTRGGNLYAKNCLFGNAANHSGIIAWGGEVEFDYCTFGNYWTSARNSALLVVQDYYVVNNTIQYRPFTFANFNDCIVYGPNDNEFVADTLDRATSGAAPVFQFTRTLVKSEESIGNSSYFTNCWSNQDPEFSNPGSWDFHIPTTSAAAEKGNGITISVDLEGNPRMGVPDLGCLESI